MSTPIFGILHHLDGDSEERTAARVYAEVLEQVVLADDVGFDVVWFAEHRGAGRGGRLSAPWSFIPHAAVHARRITLGTAVTLLPYYHPLAVAEQVAVADLLTGGRVLLGIGSGSNAADFAAFGLDPATKHDRLREGLTVLRGLWSGEPVTFKGEHYHLQEAHLRPLPSRPARDLVWLAAGGLPTARLAGEFDLHLLLARSTTRAKVAELVEAYQAARREHGHTTPDRYVQRTNLIYVDTTDAAARATAEASIRHYFAGLVRAGLAEGVGDDLDSIVARLDIIVGEPERAVEELTRRILDFGLTHVALTTRLPLLPHELALRSTRLLGEQVLPLVRERVRQARALADAPVLSEAPAAATISS